MPLTPKITTVIGPRSAEIVRDRIAQILALELANQATLSGDTWIESPVYIERWVPVNVSECEDSSVIIVSIDNLDKANATPIDSDINLTFSIQVFTSKEATETNDSDVESMFRNQRIVGIIDGILSHPYYIYNTLDFEKPFLMKMGVQNAKFGFSNREESAVLVVGNLSFLVTVAQNEPTNTGEEWTQSETVAKLFDSNKGFKYIRVNP